MDEENNPSGMYCIIDDFKRICEQVENNLTLHILIRQLFEIQILERKELERD